MKKQIKKLRLNKITISNLTATEMGNKNGGTRVHSCDGTCRHCNTERNGNTCIGHKTCYIC